MKKFMFILTNIILAFAVGTALAVLFNEPLALPIGGGLLFASTFIPMPQGIAMFALANYTKTCTRNIAGNSTLYVNEAANISTVTVVAGEVTALTTSSDFLTVDVDIDTLVRSQEGTGKKGNMTYLHKIEAVFSYLSATLNTFRDALVTASSCGIIVLTKDSNGVWWLTGWNEIDEGSRGLELITDNDTSGKESSEDGAGEAMISLQRPSGYLDLPVKSTSTVAVTGITI
jgi:hypothetical protein